MSLQNSGESYSNKRGFPVGKLSVIVILIKGQGLLWNIHPTIYQTKLLLFVYLRASKMSSNDCFMWTNDRNSKRYNYRWIRHGLMIRKRKYSSMFCRTHICYVPAWQNIGTVFNRRFISSNNYLRRRRMSDRTEKEPMTNYPAFPARLTFFILLLTELDLTLLKKTWKLMRLWF